MSMKRLIIALCATIPAALAGGCATDYGYGYDGGVYAGGPYVYDGYYDDFYGPIYDGYWGDDGYFYYRGSANDREYRRGDQTHFARDTARGGNFHAIHGTTTPVRGTRMPHYSGGRQGRERTPH
jgi:hypothetical protein